MRPLFVVAALMLFPMTAAADPDHTPSEPCEKKRFLHQEWETNKVDLIQEAICSYQMDVFAAKRSIAEEYKLARISGGHIIDKAVIYDYQQNIATSLRRILDLRQMQRSLKKKPLSCSDLRNVLACEEADPPERCLKAPYSLLHELLIAFKAKLDGELQYEFCPSEPDPFTY